MTQPPLISLLLALAFTISPAFSQTTRAAPQKLPDSVERRAVTIFSDGVRMAGDLYMPRQRAADPKLPAIVICAGTAGTKGTTGRRMGPIFADHGYIALAFDYRGWGESDSKLITLDKQPRPDADGNVQVTARAVRWQMDFADEAMDIRAAISFIMGQTEVDPARIALWGTSYGGGLVTWSAGNDPRIHCVVAQVPGMGGGRGPAANKYAWELLTKQSRGDTEPVPFESGKFTGKMSRYAQMRVNPAKAIGYDVMEAAEKIKAPMLIVDAEKDELVDPHQNGERVANILKSHDVPVQYEVIKDITHYGVYVEAFDQATKLELDWLDQRLQDAK
jgi:hypothetical protein